MGKKLLLTGCLAVLITILGCGGGDYDDAVKANTKFIDAMESYLQDIDKADSAPAMADAIVAYAEKIEALAPEMKAVAAKHPDWKDINKVPEELKPLQEKAQAVAARIPASFMKSMQYMTDPKVQEANKKLQEAMMKMR